MDSPPVSQLNYPDPELADDFVRLRPWRLDDIGCIEQAATDKRIPGGTTVPAVYTPAEGRAFVERQWSRQTSGQGISLAIADVDNGEAVGLVVLLNRKMPGTAGIGYWVIPTARRRGRVTRAIRLLSHWAVTDGGLARVDAHVMPDNEPSLRALRSCGFATEGVLRSHYYLEGRHYDMVSLSLIPGDLEQSSG